MLAQMCKKCGSFVSNPVKKCRGSWWVWIILVLFSIIDWVLAVIYNDQLLIISSWVLVTCAFFYGLWMEFFKKKCCPKCESEDLVGIDTVIGKELYAKLDPKDIPSGQKICPKCKKMYDDSWEVCLNDGEKLQIFQVKQDTDSTRLKEGSVSSQTGVYSQIEELSKLKEKGILSQDEFDSKKKELLERI